MTSPTDEAQGKTHSQRGLYAAAAATGAGLACVVLLAAFWRELTVEHYLQRLRAEADPAVQELLSATADSPEGEALLGFADTAGGAQVLSRVFVKDALALRSSFGQGPPGERLGQSTGLLAVVNGLKRPELIELAAGGGGGTNLEGRETFKQRLIRVPQLLRQSRAVARGEVGPVEVDDWIFRVFRRDRAYLLTGFSQHPNLAPLSAADPVWVYSFSGAKPGSVRIPECVLPGLMEALRERRDGVEFLAAARSSLELLGVDPAAPIPGLIERLRDEFICAHDPNPHAWRLSRLRKPAWAIIPAPARCLADLGPSVLPAVTAALEAQFDPIPAERALPVFQEIGEPALPFLDHLLTSRGHRCWTAALQAKLAIQSSLAPPRVPAPAGP